MKDRILTINTTNPEKTAILLAEKISNNYKIIAKKIWRAKKNQSEELLPEIDKLLSNNKVSTEKLSYIIVCIGPGSFTGTRVGVATANAIAFGLEIPVVGVKAADASIEQITKKGFLKFRAEKTRKKVIAKPFYSQAPNITKPKDK